MKHRMRRLTLLVSLVGLCAATPAWGYCRMNSCDPARGDECTFDANSCLVGGLPLFRASLCVSFAVHKDGSIKNQIDAAAFEATITQAFSTWTSADCGNGLRPSIYAESLGHVICGQAEFNEKAANANIYMFRDSTWLAEGSDYALGLTTVSYFPKTGEIYDTDVEINGSGGDITNAGPLDGVDLASLVTHETGHFLGLAHSPTLPSVMHLDYKPRRDNLRVLHADDIAGICATYPPDRQTSITSCGPRGGFSSTCDPPLPSSGGCTVSARTNPSPLSELLLLAFVTGLLLQRRFS